MTTIVYTVKCDGCGRTINAIEESYNVVEDIGDFCDKCYAEL